MKNHVEFDIVEDHLYPVGIALEESFILEWSLSDNFVIQLDLAIWPASAYYTEPPKGHYTCYKRGALTFYNVTEINGFVDLESVQPNIDMNGKKDWEEIESLRINDDWIELDTDFTEMKIWCAGFGLSVDG